MEKQIFTVSNMNCNGCVSNIKQALEADKRVANIDFELTKKLVTVSGDLTPEEVAGIIQEAGYDASIGAQKTGFLNKLFSS